VLCKNNRNHSLHRLSDQKVISGRLSVYLYLAKVKMRMIDRATPRDKNGYEYLDPPHPPRTHRNRWVRGGWGDGGNGFISPGALPRTIHIKPFQGKMQYINHPYQSNVQRFCVKSSHIILVKIIFHLLFSIYSELSEKEQHGGKRKGC
jgi:hypothetical protein